MSRMLFNDQPVVINRELANLIGLNEAIVLQQVHYWIENNKKAGRNFIEGRYWTYNSIQKWHKENFAFWSLDTVKRTFSKLVKIGIFITGDFNKDGRDRTKWYSIDEDALEWIEESVGQRINGSESEEIITNFDSKASEENDSMQLGKMTQCISANCTNALGQEASMHKGNLHQPLPKTSTKISSEISNSIHPSEETQDTPKTKGMDGGTHKQDYIAIEKAMREQLDYETLELDMPLEANLLKEIMLSLVEMHYGEIIVGGVTKSNDLVRKAIGELKGWHIQQVIQNYKECKNKIRRPKAYIQAALFNAAFSSNLQTQNEVEIMLSGKNDFGKGG